MMFVLVETKPKPRKFVLKADRIAEYFPDDTSDEEIEQTILELLEEWKASKK